MEFLRCRKLDKGLPLLATVAVSAPSPDEADSCRYATERNLGSEVFLGHHSALVHSSPRCLVALAAPQPVATGPDPFHSHTLCLRSLLVKFSFVTTSSLDRGPQVLKTQRRSETARENRLAPRQMGATDFPVEA